MNLKGQLTRRRFFYASIAAVGLYTWRVEPHWLEIVHRTLPVRHLPASLVGAKLVHATDLHIGPQVDDDYLTGVFRMIRDLQPEFVVYTGDFISTDTELQNHAPRMMASLPHGKLGTFGVLGNHDYGNSFREIHVGDLVAKLAENAGVRVLRNEMVNVQGLQIIGLDDLWAHLYQPNKVFPNVNPSGAAITLVHNPDAVDQPGWDNFTGWILCGHTHGGQCKAPFLPPPILPVNNRRYTRGAFDLSGNRRLYIGRGIGHILRVRFNVRPELTVFQLVQG